MLFKPRPPLSTAQALARIEGQLPGGIEEMARITTRSTSLVRAWGDQDRRENIPLDDAIALDLAYQAAGGDGFPLADSYLFRLELEAAVHFAEQYTLLEKTERFTKEVGDALAALLAACQPGAGHAERANAFKELVEAVEHAKPMLVSLDPARAPGSTPAAPANAAQPANPAQPEGP